MKWSLTFIGWKFFLQSAFALCSRPLCPLIPLDAVYATNCAALLWIHTGAERNWFSVEMLKNYNGLQISIAVDVGHIIVVTSFKYDVVLFLSLSNFQCILCLQPLTKHSCVTRFLKAMQESTVVIIIIYTLLSNSILVFTFRCIKKSLKPTKLQLTPCFIEHGVWAFVTKYASNSSKKAFERTAQVWITVHLPVAESILSSPDN